MVAAHFTRNRVAVREVTIVPAGDSVGHVVPFSRPSFRPDLNPRLHEICDRIVVLLAGAAAEKRFGGRARHVGAGQDYKMAVDLAAHVTSSVEETEALIDWLLVRTDELVEIRWGEIEALATALMERRTMTGTQARRVIAEYHSSPDRCWPAVG